MWTVVERFVFTACTCDRRPNDVYDMRFEVLSRGQEGIEVEFKMRMWRLGCKITFGRFIALLDK